MEYTGPSMIYNRNVAAGDLAGEIRALRDENMQLGLALEANTRKVAKVIDKWDGEGLPDTSSNITAWGN